MRSDEFCILTAALESYEHGIWRERLIIHEKYRKIVMSDKLWMDKIRNNLQTSSLRILEWENKEAELQENGI